jgi:Flagellar basal body-associated protein FliL
MAAKKTESGPQPADAKPAGKSGVGGLIAGLALATALAAGAGFANATFLPGAPSAAPAAAMPPTEAPSAHGGGGHGGDAHGAPDAHGGKAKEGSAEMIVSGPRELPPIVTNLAAPEGTWIRLECAILFDNLDGKTADILQKEIPADIMTYLRTLSLPQIQGGLGLQHLREDLNERVAARSQGKVKEIIVYTMVVQ